MIKDFISKFKTKRYYYVVDEENVTKVLSIVNSQFKWLKEQQLVVGNCQWVDEPGLWFIHFDAKGKQIVPIIKKLTAEFKMVIKDQPERIYLEKKEES